MYHGSRDCTPINNAIPAATTAGPRLLIIMNVIVNTTPSQNCCSLKCDKYSNNQCTAPIYPQITESKK